MTTKNKETGLLGETLAANYLQAQGWHILKRNWEYKYWEMDLIAQKGDCLLFAEVKTFEFGFVLPPVQKMGKTKLRALGQAAEAWLSLNDFEGQIRFDLLYVLLQQQPPEVLHYQDVWFPNNWGR
ncbi:MAG: endonuclease [Sphingobacteriaceae bacterium]|nr:endonuclease [Sphingobacteriaceae bacterium]